jgi:hypothetical protein
LYYDTLMQMGRWFGYRGRYVDLTRLYSTELLVSCFHDLATAEEDLRKQIARYDRDKLTPTKFVPKVRTHPLMAVTQRSKMQAAIEVSLNYAGERVQTLRFLESPTPDLQSNLEVARSLFWTLGPPDETNDHKPSWSGVDPRVVMQFLSDFRVISQTAIDPRSVIDYIDKQLHNGELTRWRVLLSCARDLRDDPVWSEDLGVTGMPRVPLIARSRLKNDPTSLGVVTEPTDELLGLTAEDIRAADDDAADHKYTSRAEAYRAHRDPAEGLLMIYPISAAAEGRPGAANRIRLFAKDAKDAATLVAYAVSFPFSGSDATVEYISAPPPMGTL